MEKELLYTVDNFVPYLESALDAVEDDTSGLLSVSGVFYTELQRYTDMEDVWRRRAWQHALITVFTHHMPFPDICKSHPLRDNIDWWKDLFYSCPTSQWWEVLEAMPVDYMDTLPLPPLNQWTGSLTPRQVASLYKKGWITDDGIAHFYLQGQAFGSHCTGPFLHMLRCDLIEYHDMVGNRNSATMKNALHDFHERYAAFETLYGSIPETTSVPIAYQRLQWTRTQEASSMESTVWF